MISSGEAYIIDTFIKMLITKFSLPEEIAWEIIHNTNLSKITFPIFSSVSDYIINTALEPLEKTAVYLYKQDENLPEVKMHSIYQEWKTVSITYINNKYKFEILEMN